MTCTPSITFWYSPGSDHGEGTGGRAEERVSGSTAELIREARERVAGLAAGELREKGFLPREGMYFPAVLYPPMPMYRPLGDEEFFGAYEGRPKKPFVIYAHIPFCVLKCRFCHFVSWGGVDPAEKDDYLDALEKEMDLYGERLGFEKFPAAAINIGGGTATCLSPRQLERFLGFFTARLDLSSCEQFTLDVDVSTLLGDEGRERLRILHGHGVDRLTIGAQVFDDVLLEDMNRANRSADVDEAVRNARDAGIDNLCIDLIYGYPGQTPENWLHTLRKAASLGVDSFQAYRLRIKPHNLLPGSIAERHAKSPGDFPPLEDVYVMKALSSLVAREAGYSDESYTTLFLRRQRGISAYHRRKFCDLYDVLGFGLATNNVLGGNVAIKTKEMGRYRSLVEAGSVPVAQGKICSPDDLLRRAVIGPLRNLSAVDKGSYHEETGREVSEVFAERLGRLRDFGIFEERESEWRLTKRGHFFVDEACIQFFHPDYIPFPRGAYVEGALNPYNQTLPLGE